MNMNLIKIDRLIDEATARIYYTKETKIELLNKCIKDLIKESKEENGTEKINKLLKKAADKIEELEGRL